jgi:cell division protein FtsB
MKKIINGLIVVGFIFIITGLIIKCKNLNDEIKNLNNKIDQIAVENIKLKEENNALWDNYYMNVSNNEGYEYYE